MQLVIRGRRTARVALGMRRLLRIATSVVLLSCGGCWTQQHRQLLESGGVRPIAPETFLRGRVGMSETQIAALYGSPGRHEFTLNDAHIDYECVNYMPEPAEFDSYYFVFRNGMLWKIVDRPGGFSGASQPFAHPTEPGPTAPGMFGNEQRARRIVVDGLNRTPEQVRARIKSAESWLRETATWEKNIPAWLGGIIYLVDWPRMQFKIASNAQLNRRQDGSRVSPGMTPNQIVCVLGRPVSREDSPQGLCAVLYGQAPDIGLENSGEYEARRVAVIYRDGKAVAILSHDFAPVPRHN